VSNPGVVAVYARLELPSFHTSTDESSPQYVGVKKREFFLMLDVPQEGVVGS
jgi:hypothetical protein